LPDDNYRGTMEKIVERENSRKKKKREGGGLRNPLENPRGTLRKKKWPAIKC